MNLPCTYVHMFYMDDHHIVILIKILFLNFFFLNLKIEQRKAKNNEFNSPTRKGKGGKMSPEEYEEQNFYILISLISGKREIFFCYELLKEISTINTIFNLVLYTTNWFYLHFSKKTKKKETSPAFSGWSFLRVCFKRVLNVFFLFLLFLL